MKIEFVNGRGYATIIREKEDAKIYSDSALWHKIKKQLIVMGYDVIKKLMHKDGNMVDSSQHYVRTKNYFTGKGSGFALHFGNYMIYPMYEDWNDKGSICLEFHKS